MKTIILTESQHKILVKKYLYEDTGFPANPEIVLMIKKFLDGHFNRGKMEQFDDDGKIVVVPIVAIVDSQGNSVKNYSDKDLFYYLEEEFKDTFNSKEERKRILTQIIKDWYYNKIGLYGSLSVNHL
jgi:hypothetical protein